MTAIYPITALQRNPKELREKAASGIVHITENGSSAYVFCSEEAFAERIRREREDAAFEARLDETIGRGLADIQTGNFYTDIDEALRRVEELRGNHAAC
jgi:predicted transcriptional regulator